MIHTHIQTQMRAGTHYLLSNLVRLYGRTPAIVTRSGAIEPRSLSWLDDGLYDNPRYGTLDPDALIVQSHFYSAVPDELRDADCPVVYQIGFPLDTYISEGLSYWGRRRRYDVAPSRTSPVYESYRLCFDSPEFEDVKHFAVLNAEWLDWLREEDPELIVRYEDYYLDLAGTVRRIEAHCGECTGAFDAPRKNARRVYWTGDVADRLDRPAFEYLMDLFGPSIEHFWPERADLRWPEACTVSSAGAAVLSGGQGA